MSRQTIYLIVLVDRKKAMMFTLLEGFAVGKSKKTIKAFEEDTSFIFASR